MQDCPYCGYPVTDRNAHRCTSCGYVFRKFSDGFRLIRWALMAVVGLGATAYLLFSGAVIKPVVSRPVQVPPPAKVYPIAAPALTPGDLYTDFLECYRVKRDPRFQLAAITALDLIDIGATLQEEARRRPLVSILPGMGFAEALAATQACLQPLIPAFRPPEAPAERSDEWWTAYRLILTKFNRVDARSIVAGFLKLEELHTRKGPDARLHLAAARGYALLKMGLYADYMQRSDAFGVLALTHLLLARHLDPAIIATREEALVAMTLGYSAHAVTVLDGEQAPAEQPSDPLIDAYIRKDITSLKSTSADGTQVLRDYLLMRLYRESGLYDQAEAAALERARKASDHYPTIVELIYSGDLGIAKMLTEYYPRSLMAYTRHQVSDGTFLKRAVAGIPQLRALMEADPQKRDGPRLVRFDELLSRWQPLQEGAQTGRFIDAQWIKTIYRALFEGAVSLRFNLLLNRWGVVDKAQHYLQTLSEGAETHPLALRMAVELAAEKGERNRVQTLFKKLASTPDVPARILVLAYSRLDDDVSRMRYIGWVAQGLDGRPDHLKNMGYLLSSAKNVGLACHFYERAQALDPFDSDLYHRQARLRGSPEPLQRALAHYPGHFKVLEAAGDYYAEQSDHALKVKAVEFYDRALELAPTRTRLWRSKVKVLREMKQYQTAAETLERWLVSYGRGDLKETIMRARLARVYLDMGLLQQALTVIEPTKDSYQAGAMICLARTYEAVGRLAEAEEMFNKAIERYPTVASVLADRAGFFWRQGRFAEAADCVATGRRLVGPYSYWYFDVFMEVFCEAPLPLITQAVETLTAKGADAWDIMALALRYEKFGQPAQALALMDKAAPPNAAGAFEFQVTKSEIVRRWRGEAAAAEILAPYLKAPLSGGQVMYCFQEGMYSVLLTALGDPDAYPQKQREFVWLMKLMSWLACAPVEEEGTAAALQQHYRAESTDHYHAIGRHLLGTLSREELLKRIKTPKQVCEVAYYLGFAERLASNFDAAANWYQICLETGLRRNGEYHWAFNELNIWALLGADRRHRRLTDDQDAYHRLRGV